MSMRGVSEVTLKEGLGKRIGDGGGKAGPDGQKIVRQARRTMRATSQIGRR